MQGDAPVEPAPKGIQWTTGEYRWKVGGYIKLDMIHDFDEIGSTDSFDPRTIPTTGADEPGDSTRFHARETRLNVEVTGPTSAGPFRAFVEGDFFSDDSGFRLRHAYGTVGEVLGGQTWTTFMDVDAMPETIDFESPIAYPSVRQAQIRWTRALGDESSFALSLEDPDSQVVAATPVPGEVEELLPDLDAHLRWGNDRGHVQLGLFGGMARFDPVAGSPDDVWLWAANLSTAFLTVGEDNAIVQLTYGDGAARYRGGAAAAPDANGNLEAIPAFGVLGSYQHYWSEKWRSTAMYSWGEGDIPDGAPATANEELTYAAVNLIWQFCDRAWTGIEFLHGTRDTFDGEDGDASRLQLAIRFDI